MKIGLVDFDGRITNLALQKLSSFYKSQGHQVVLNPLTPVGLDKTFVSLIFTKSRSKAYSIYGSFPGVEFGGTGHSITKKLPDEIEAMRPDYDLYQTKDIFQRIQSRVGKRENIQAKAVEIVNAGIGFLSRGCVRKCEFCAVPEKEGRLHRVGSLSEIINPKSNKLALLDNSLAANPDVLEILAEIKERKLVVDISQGVDIRLLTPEIAKALSEVKHWRSLHFAWDLPEAKKSVLEGINILSQYVKKSAQMCFVLTGFNTSWEQDVERVEILKELGVRPYIMCFQSPHEPPKKDMSFEAVRRRHFKRYVNLPAAIYKTSPFSEFSAWITAQEKLAAMSGASQLDLDWA